MEEELDETECFGLEEIAWDRKETQKELEILSTLVNMQKQDNIYNEKIQLEYVLPINGVSTSYTIGLGDELGREVLSLIEDSIFKRLELLSAIEQNLETYRLKKSGVTRIEKSSNASNFAVKKEND